MDNTMRDVINAAREYGFFVDRGDPVNQDYAAVDFTKDDAWHELDLSAIVPEHAHATLISIITRGNAVDRSIAFRRNGNANERNIASFRIQVANVRLAGDLVCPCSADRKLDYQVEDNTVNVLNFTVKGWWY